MRVLFVTHTVLMAGANRSMFQLIKELKAVYGVEPVVLMPKIHKNYQKWNLFKACQEERIECLSYRFNWFKGDKRLITYLRCLLNLFDYPLIYRKLRKQNYDIIHSNGSVITLGAYLSVKMKIPHVWHLREYGDLDFGLKPLFGKKYEKWAYCHGDVFIAISDVIKEHYLPVVKSEKIVRIYNGIIPVDSSLWAKHNNSLTQFCMVGLLSSPKNQLEALKAAKILLKDCGVTEFHITFVGFEEPVYTQIMRRFAVENGLEPYVSFMGEQKDVSSILAKMDVGLMLSNNEAFGRVTVEYMMHGLVVIASDSGANPEIITDNKTGFLYHLGDAEMLASRMRSLIEDRSLLQKMATSGMEMATNNFTSLMNTKNVHEVYLSLTKSS